MDDDFNTAGALGSIFSLIGSVNTFLMHGLSNDADVAAARHAVETVTGFMGTLGIDFADDDKSYPAELVDLARELLGSDADTPEQAVDLLLAGRAEARATKDWGTADAIRDGLSGLGFVIEDTASGARVHYEG